MTSSATNQPPMSTAANNSTTDMATAAGGFCNDPLWDTDLLLSSSWPQFTSCFTDTVLVYLPFSVFWVPLPFYLHRIMSEGTRSLPISCLSVVKLFLTTSLCLLSLIIIIEDISNIYGNSPVSSATYLANAIRVASFAAAAVMIYVDRKYHCTSSGLLFVFYLILVLFDIVPLYTKIMLFNSRVSAVSLTLFALSYALEVFLLVLNGFRDSTGEESYPTRTSPEVTASYFSRLIFTYPTRLVFNGWRKDLKEEDLFDLHPRDLSDTLVPRFEKEWICELARFERKRQKDAPHEFSRDFTMSDLSSSQHSEKGPLLSNMNGKIHESSNYKTVTRRPDKEKSKEEKPSLMRVLALMMGKRVFIGLVQKLVSDVFLLTSPVLLSLLISYADNKDSDYPWKGYALAVLMFLTQCVKSVLFNLSFWTSQIMGLQLKTTLIAAVYKKALTINYESRKDSTAGEIVNLMSVDCQRVQDVMNYFYFAWTTPFQVVLVIAVLYQYIGAATFAGLAVLLLTIPFNSYVFGRQQSLQRGNLKHKDARLRLTNESLSGMKVLKLYAWEPAFTEKIADTRADETSVLLQINYLNMLVGVCFSLTPYLVILASFAVYVAISDDNHLDASKAFVTLSYFNLLRVPLNLLSTIISMSVQAVVSVERIRNFLCNGDLNPNNIIKDSRAIHAVEVENCTFTWEKGTTPTLRNISVNIPDGKLFAVVGPVGCGKSSFVSALLGEMERLSGKAVIKSKVAYVPQQAWIQNATVKDNILFGKPYNRRRYKQVIHACALERDLQILAAGDMTEIGEKGINLSGGQKQRISLARAVYSNEDIYLFDDPLSAVDSHVGKHIFNNVIGRKGVLSSKTRVLVTHGAHWLPMVDSILVLDDGVVREAGTYEDLMSHNGPFAEFIKTYLLQSQDDDEANEDPEIRAMKAKIWTDVESATSDGDALSSGDDLRIRKRHTSQDRDRSRSRTRRTTITSAYESSIMASGATQSEQIVYSESNSLNKDEGKLVQKEKMEEGKVKLSVFAAYGRAAGMVAIILALLLFAFFQITNVASNFWLTGWTEDSYLANISLSQTAKYRQTNNYYLGIFGLLGVIQFAFLIGNNILYWYRMTVAAKRLHYSMLKSLFRSPMSFFDTTPLGRIMNRFSRDIEVVDNNLPIIIRDYFNTLMAVISIAVTISITTPIFLVLVVPILIIFYMTLKFYIPTSRQLKRIESVTRSPIYTHFSETISGGPTIRAYDVTARFIRESKQRVDRNQSFFYGSLTANRWLATILELLSNVVILGSAIFAVITPEVKGGEVGLSVSYAMQISSSIVWMVRQMSELETNIVSVERLKEYSELQEESDWIIPHRRPKRDWPTEGKVKFSDYMTRYRPGLDLVLRGITCDFKAGEKIGIVGRTGAGKSSLALALFRLIEASSGSITIDGINISDIGLHDVRSHLTILPQDPVLFFGTLRMNLDPLGEYPDHKLWSVLTSAYLRDFVNGLDEGLDYQVGEEGQSLSVGQRQLVCLARSLLKKTKILILDEATAAVDMETDTLIQNTIRTEFGDCTIITIAHRLNTIMDYDRIMVLDAGLVKELDSPTNLLANQESIFYSMAKEANII